MPTVFLSYSTRDHYFAELAGIKLADEGINLWRDQGQLRAGSDWRNGIEHGISNSARRGLQPRCLRLISGAGYGDAKRFGRVYKTRPAFVM